MLFSKGIGLGFDTFITAAEPQGIKPSPRMKILVDTNVILDVLLRRSRFYDQSAAVYDSVERHICTGYISSSAITDIFYIACRELKNPGMVYRITDILCKDFVIAPVLDSTIKGALALRWRDFEDAVQYMAACESGADYIITRNKTDYETAALPVVTPEELLSIAVSDWGG